MTPSLVSRLAFVFVLAVMLPCAAQSPPTAGFPIEPAPPGSAQPPAAAPTPSVPPSSAAPPPPPAPTSAPPSSLPVQSAVAPAPTAPAPAAQPSSPPLTRVISAPPLPPPAPETPGVEFEGAPPSDEGAVFGPAPLLPEISFEQAPGWAVELDARGGIGVLAGSDARSAFAFGGGMLRGHYRYFELGAFYDHADSQQTGGTFAHFGGLAGAWLPYHNWVDFELAAALGVRRYTDSDPRYGSNGYALNAPALSFIVGVSDRARSGNLGGRVGGQLVMSEDLKQKTEPWLLQETSDAGDLVTTTGKTHAGGFSVSLVLVIGLDYGDGP